MANKIWVGGTSGDYSVAGNWSPSGVPAAADNVTIQGSVAITAGLNQSAIAIAAFVVDPSYTGTIGDVTTYLQVNCTSFEFSGSGKSFIDVGSSSISPAVNNTSTPTTGAAGLYLKGSAIATLTVRKGTVGLAWLAGETATVTTANCQFLTQKGTDAGLLIGSGVTLTTLNVTGGKAELRCAATTVTANAGTLTIRGSGAITTVNNNGATVYPNSTGTITTLNANSGTTDFTQNITARTVTTLATTSDDANVLYDPAAITVTNKLAPTGPSKITIAHV